MSKPAPVDPGLRRIDDWHKWFIEAHTQRMKDDGYDDAALTRARVDLETLAANIRERMIADYRANQNRERSPQP